MLPQLLPSNWQFTNASITISAHIFKTNLHVINNTELTQALVPAHMLVRQHHVINNIEQATKPSFSRNAKGGGIR